MFIVGLDIGGTKSEATLLEFRSDQQPGWLPYHLPQPRNATRPYPAGWMRPLFSKRQQTGRARPYDEVISDLTSLIQSLLAEQHLRPNDLAGIGLALPGSIEPRRKVMLSGSTGVFIGQDVVGDLQKKLRWQGLVCVENDANCFAWAEACAGAGLRFGATIGERTILGIILGTGVGGGVVIGGTLLSGRRGGAGEWGHTLLFPGGAPCYCGNQGCTERYLSGAGLEAQYHQLFYQLAPERPSAAEIFALAEAREPMAIGVVKQYQRHLGQFLGMLSQCFDPDLIVLGGGVSQQPRIYEGLTEQLLPYLFVKECPPEVVQHGLGDAAGGIGAALLVHQQQGG